jgi:putative mycofactocin binding protein MftB
VTASFDVQERWALDDRVALRPESFGALAYHFGTRRLSFLKHPQLVRVVESLGDHPSAADAVQAAGVADNRREAIVRALATLAETGMIVSKEGAGR